MFPLPKLPKIAALSREPINGKTVVVTGCSGGVGRALVRLLATKGCKIGMLARGSDGLEGAKRDVERGGGQALAIPTDVADHAKVESAAEAVENAFGPIEVWFNNAMVSMYSPFWEMGPDEFKHITDVTYLGQVYGTMSALKRMKPRNRGMIVQTSSALGFRSIPLQSAYCGAKHGIVGFTESLRSELIHAKSNVHISTVELPGVNTTQFEWTLNRMPHKPRPSGTIYQPEVPARGLLFAAEHPYRKRIVVGYPTWEAMTGEKFIPATLDRYLSHAAWEGAQRSEPADPNKPNNFWQPLPGDHGSHGPFDNISHDFSPMLWASEHRGGLWAGLAAVGTIACVATAINKLHDHHRRSFF